jgi:hypothetical protein
MAESGEAEVVQNIYDEIEIDDMDFEEGKFYYPCPCGDKFQITLVSICDRRLLIFSSIEELEVSELLIFNSEQT